jgi:hypothetical protein
MSTDATPRSHRASRRSLTVADVSKPALSSPFSATRNAINRFDSKSTTSSASSNLSENFDQERSNSAGPGSPLTPPCEASTPHPELFNKSHSEPKPRRKRLQNDDTPSKIQRIRTNTKKSRLPNAESLDFSDIGSSLVFPTRHPRAISAPVSPSRPEQSLDVDHLPLPGVYESQNSNVDAGVNHDGSQLPPSMTFSQNEGVDEIDQNASNEFEDTAKSIPLPFLPYTCEKGRPEVRRIIDKCVNNVEILNLIKTQTEKGRKLGWVYIAVSTEYGPEKLKIGKSKGAPGKRIRKLQQCGLELKDVLDKQKNPFHYYSLVEQVAHLELSDQRLKLICTSGGEKEKHNHKEWFDVDRKKALLVVETWRNWILIQQPFDRSGTLTAYWTWKVEVTKASIADVNWESWTQPPPWYYYIFLIRTHFSSSRKDVGFYVTSVIVTLLSFMGHGGRGAFWAVIFLLLL